MNKAEIEKFLEKINLRVDKTLNNWLPPKNTEPGILHNAMRYSVFGDGKRIRPGLIYSVGSAFNIPYEKLDSVAAAIELIHVYSLIHDDLPAMDNDDLRRGKPTCHKAFGEANAILAGDALQALAFNKLCASAEAKKNGGLCAQWVKMLGDAAGSQGMAGGQVLDLAAVGKNISKNDVEKIHRLKTGSLIHAGIMMATLLDDANLSRKENDEISQFALDIGLAFQIKDDILDVEGSSADLGKLKGSDAARGHPTYVTVFGIEVAKDILEKLLEKALQHIDFLEESGEQLRNLSKYIVRRAY